MRLLAKREAGFSLIEVLVALAILSILATGFLMTLANSSKHTLTAEVLATAESIARTQMESIKSEAYQTNAPTTPSLYSKITSLPSASWDVTWTVARLDPKNLHDGSEQGMQEITLTVKFLEGAAWDDVLTLQGYKSQ